MRFDRRIALRGLIAAPLILGGGIAAAIALPELVRARVEQRVAARAGLPVRVAEVSLGLTQVSIGELAVGTEARGPSLVARDVVIDASPIWLGLRGEKAAQSVIIGRIDGKLPLRDPESRRLMDRMRKRAGPSPGAAKDEEARPSGSALPEEIQIAQLALAIDDDAPLARVRGRAQLKGATLTLDLQRVQLGAQPSHALELERVAVQAQRSDKGFLLERVNVGSGRAYLAKVEEAEPDTAVVADDDAEDERADPPSPPGKSAAAAPQSAPAAAPAPASDPPAAKDADRTPAGLASALLDRLANNAVLNLEHASVHVGGASGPPILDGLKGTLKAQAGRVLLLSGSGKAAAGGALSCDLNLRPEQLQADGQIVLRSLPLDLIAPFLPAVPWYEVENGRVDAQLLVKTESAEVVALSGEASLRDAAIFAARIAPGPVRGIGLALKGKGRFLPLQRRLEIDEAALTTPSDATVQLSGAVEWTRDHYLFDIDAALPKTPCTNAVRAIPEDLLSDLALATWQGKLSGKLKLRLDSRKLDQTVLDLDVEDRCEFVTVPAMADLRRFHVPFTHSVLEPDGSEFQMETGPGTPNWTYIEDMSPFFVHAVLAHEDAGFFNHKGFSMLHVRNALVRNLKERRYVVGASTITMQLVKNVFLHREKTLARKIQEVLLTWWIERVMEKRDILELYLNVIEYGPKVYGIRNGAKHYFNRLPGQLSPAESIYLSTILPNPKRYHSHFERGALSPQWAENLRRMFARMRERGWYSPEAVEYGLAEIDRFKFVPEGTIVAPREIPGGTALLPYMRGFDEGAGASGWDDTAGRAPFDPFEAQMPARTRR